RIQGTRDWEQYAIELPVDAAATNINFGALLAGGGTAWFSGLRIEVDGKPYTPGDDFDLSFDSGAVRGFYTGGNGYRIRVDGEALRTGSKSLMMTRPGEAAPDKRLQTQEALAAWKAVAAHMESSRSAYREAGAANGDADWAIQNARVVLQCMLMHSGSV